MVQELNQSNIGSSVTDLNMVNTMPFGDSSSTYFPSVRGEYKSLASRTQCCYSIFDFAKIIF
jgi:hypothetical protein